MTEQQHPVTPPPHLIDQWIKDHSSLYALSRSAAKWGADQELDACCEWMNAHSYFSASIRIREDRRPKPPSLKEQALKVLSETELRHEWTIADEDIIRRALEQLPDKE